MFAGEHTKEKEKVTGGKKNDAGIQKERQLKINKKSGLMMRDLKFSWRFAEESSLPGHTVCCCVSDSRR